MAEDLLPKNVGSIEAKLNRNTRESLKNFLLTNRFAMHIASISFNLFHLDFRLLRRFQGSFVKKSKFRLHGRSIVIICKDTTRIEHCVFNVEGNNVTIEIGHKCILKNLELWIEDDYSKITIGDNTTIEGGQIAATEGREISVGSDCMFSTGVQIRNGDSHPIFETGSGKRINSARDVIIGDHVWLGSNAVILKGAMVASNTIIGTGSIVTSSCKTSNAIYAGNPAKLLRENINWARHRSQTNLYDI